MKDFIIRRVTQLCVSFRVLWYWRIKSRWTDSEYSYVTKITNDVPFLNTIIESPGYTDHRNPEEAPLYFMYEAYLTPDFREWLRKSGPYKVEIFLKKDPLPLYYFAKISFATQGQLALFKLTWL